MLYLCTLDYSSLRAGRVAMGCPPVVTKPCGAQSQHYHIWTPVHPLHSTPTSPRGGVSRKGTKAAPTPHPADMEPDPQQGIGLSRCATAAEHCLGIRVSSSTNFTIFWTFRVSKDGKARVFLWEA